MTKKKDKRGRKALPPEQKKPPQPTLKINPTLHPFVKQLKRHYKAGLVDADKLAALTALLLDDSHQPSIEEQAALPSGDDVFPDTDEMPPEDGG
ncbi:hypothetical protein KFZ76_11375 [Methylovulum psychrotolerans]|jgi:hypothetical protein|uniref:hypothetical protein n=1 Tax=Methylovulum psychrotolerans TaxID=1704499 RepID=UPI001BFF5B9E|nr:hypothetical protein [Methylovulum psychrotolerans]MBT9098305.1 hypothetical protein [Methylovulum psychrotolerans]